MWTEIIRCGFKFPSWLWLTSAETAIRELIIKLVASCWCLTCYLGTICQLFWKFFIEETALMTMILPLSLQDYSLHQHGLDLISSLFLLYMLKCNYNRKYCVKECWIYFQKGVGGWSLLLLLPFSLKFTISQSSSTKLIPESPLNTEYSHRWIPS